MAVIVTDMDIPSNCGECPFCIYTADEKRCIGYCNTSDEDYYCKALDRFMEYDKVDGGLDILGKPSDCPLKSADEMKNEMLDYSFSVVNPSNTYEYVNVVNLEDIEAVIDKYCDKEQNNEHIHK